jgi:hypothetical protein
MRPKDKFASKFYSCTPHAERQHALQGGSVPMSPQTQEINLKVLRLLENNPTQQYLQALSAGHRYGRWHVQR